VVVKGCSGRVSEVGCGGVMGVKVVPSKTRPRFTEVMVESCVFLLLLVDGCCWSVMCDVRAR
jgi:hypothetical protein